MPSAPGHNTRERYDRNPEEQWIEDYEDRLRQLADTGLVSQSTLQLGVELYVIDARLRIR